MFVCLGQRSLDSDAERFSDQWARFFAEIDQSRPDALHMLQRNTGPILIQYRVNRYDNVAASRDEWASSILPGEMP